MNAVSEVERVGGMLTSLEAKTKRRTGLNAVAARQVMARELRCAPGTLTDIIRRRVKGVDGWLRDRIADALLATIKSEITRLANEELEIRRGCRTRALRGDLAEVEADLARLRAIAGIAPPEDVQ